MKPFNILFTSAGRRVALIELFKKAIVNSGISGQVVTADMSRLSAASFVADQHELVPAVHSPEYINRLLKICRQHEISLLVPLIDTELVTLAEHFNEFESSGTKLLVSSVETNRICFDKRLTAEFFSSVGVRTPRLFCAETILADKATQYPFFLKPASGSSSVGATRINNPKELLFFKDYIQDGILQEYVAGQEYTLDVLVDFNGKVRTVVPRLRIETRAGEVSKGMTVHNSEIMEAGRHVAASLPGAQGCITIQCFLTPDDDIVFIEINPRFGGGFPLAAHAGADFPGWLIQTLTGVGKPVDLTKWQQDVVMLRYDDAVFLKKEDVFV